MSEDQRPPAAPSAPVAIRITRPYATEEELLQHEPETITRTGVTLLGAQPRPQGVVLRFELALSGGNPVLRGEGRVVGYKPDAHDGLGGLTLRFTRLDSRSKSLVDKAAAVRDQRRQSLPPAAGSSIPPPLPPPAPTPSSPSVARAPVPASASSRPSTPPFPPPAPSSGSSIPLEVADASGPFLAASALPSAPEVADPPSVPPPPSAPAPASAPPPASSPRPADAPALAEPRLAPPAGRDALLGRLRSRAQGLDATHVARILTRK